MTPAGSDGRAGYGRRHHTQPVVGSSKQQKPSPSDVEPSRDTVEARKRRNSGHRNRKPQQAKSSSARRAQQPPAVCDSGAQASRPCCQQQPHLPLEQHPQEEMKFGKRLLAEASRTKWSNHFFDYRAIKKAIKDDVQVKDARGSNFQKVMLSELQRVSAFYAAKAEELEKTLGGASLGARDLNLVQLEVKDLIKFVALNYLAVVKAIKKRNRHLKENFGSLASTSMHALNLLEHEVFFTSPRLAGLATQAEVLSKQLASPTCSSQAAALEDYQCPICLDTLHNPVVLTCAHRFCWGCLVAHCTSTCTLPHTSPNKKGTDFTAASSYQLLEDIASQEEVESAKFYNCPVCRKPQVLDLDKLQVDAYLSNFVEGLKAVANVTLAESKPQHIPTSQWGIIPPQSPRDQGKLCVLLDLDGTLVSSFTPRRAPRLPPYTKTHTVGAGSKLNPHGVFVVERPGLAEFLEELGQFAEIIVFTAGLEDYAKPIIDALDPHNRIFAHRIYREGTVATEYYQCVKDMARLNRDMAHTVLVDDTPLAFLHQPDNGVPVLGFRGEPDDRLLMEAVLPLLQALSTEPDVRTVLGTRFNMGAWFRGQGFPLDKIMQSATEAVDEEKAAFFAQHQPKRAAAEPQPCSCSKAHQAVPVVPQHSVSTPQQCASRSVRAAPVQVQRPVVKPSKRFLVLTDFDKTLTDFDAGERVMEHLAPELLPMLMGMETPANFVPVTNTLLAELQRRGVSRDQLVATLQQLGQEVPVGSVQLLQHLSEQKVDIRVLSDANSVFINHILAGAKVANLVKSVTTNPASFERVAASAAEASAEASASAASTSLGGMHKAASTHKLVIQPHHACCETEPHKCPRCPSNLCKGLEVAKVKAQSEYESIIYCGDGANDVCAALSLSAGDVVLARQGYPLAQYLQLAATNPSMQQTQATVRFWATHEELYQYVTEVVSSGAV